MKLLYIFINLVFINISFGITIGDEFQNIGNAISNLGSALNGTTQTSQTSQCNAPPGWTKGNKRGFVNGLPPGLAKKGLVANNNCENLNYIKR